MHIESASAKNVFRCRRTSRMLNLKREANDRFAEVASSALRTLVGKNKYNFSGTEYDSLKQAGQAHPGQLTFGADRQGLREGLGGVQQGSRANNSSPELVSEAPRPVSGLHA
ncbi:hypothetical protein [Streptomyces sp. enrichment culture]|uniref:hypothetical protein n=1 Tax=Streptomyces sp. enrichment culture TaxID=1795815 RepID=UPI003363A142